MSNFEQPVNQPLPFEKHSKMLLQMKRYREAAMVCAKWVEAQPNNGNAWFYKSLAETNAHQPAAALDSADRALQVKPGNLLIMAQKAQVLGVLGHSKECLALIAQCEEADNPHPGISHQIGNVLNNIGEHSRAITHFERVRSLQPEMTDNLVSLSTAYHIVGRSEEAEAIQLEAIRQQPDNFRAYWLLGQMRKATPDNNHVALLEKTLQRNQDSLQARISLNYALAKQQEELENYPQAFVHLQSGAAAVLEHSPYDQQRDQQITDAMQRDFDSSFIAADSRSNDSDAPIFIVGMPRTGTTLLEQILCTYADIETAGELHHFMHIMNRACVAQGKSQDPDQIYADADQLDWASIANSYLTQARLHVPGSRYFIDKYPLNFLAVGPILKAFPNAKVINLTRNPMDTCFSNYKLLFRLGSALHSYDLNTMADYYARYRKMMAHWHELMPGMILDVSYESLVQEPETTTRRVTDFLGLDWQQDCLDFYKRDSAVATASSAQVRNPINTGSLNKWHKFEAELAPLAAALARHGIPLDQ